MNEPVGASVTYGYISIGRRTGTTFPGYPTPSNRFLKGLAPHSLGRLKHSTVRIADLAFLSTPAHGSA
jgi:hypothetical protein